MDIIKDFATSGPIIKAASNVHKIAIPIVVPVVRAAGRSVSIANHYGNQYNDCIDTDHTITQCVAAGSAAFLTESCHRAVGGLAIGSSVELAATGVGALPATALATVGYKIFLDGRDNGDIVHKCILDTIDEPKKPIEVDKFIVMGIPGVIGDYKQTDDFIIAKANMEKLDEIKRNLDNFKIPEEKQNERKKIIKHETKKVIEIVDNIDDINSDIKFTEKKDNIQFYHTASQIVSDSSYILRELGEPKLATTIDNLQHVIKISSGIDNIMNGGTLIATGGILSAIVGGMCLVKSLFGNDKKQDNTMVMYNALSAMITQAFNTIMTRLYLLELHMNKRFDQLEYKLDKMHLIEYILMRDVYLQGKDIMYYMNIYNENIKDKLENVKTIIMIDNKDLKKSLLIMNDNFNSFRFEKINELISEIDYTIAANLMNIDKVHLYLGKLFNIVNNLLNNDYITGRHIIQFDTISKIRELKNLTYDRLINYFSKDIKLTNPILWIVITNYTKILINQLDIKQLIHDNIITSLKMMGNQYNIFIQNVINYDNLINQANENINNYKLEFIQKKQNEITNIRKHNITRDITMYQESIDEVLKLSPFSYYTEISHRMKISEFGEYADGNLIKTLNRGNSGCCCSYRRYLIEKKSAKQVPFILSVYNKSSWQFCGNGHYGDISHHRYGCGMHRNTTSKALYINYPDRTKLAINSLVSHDNDYIQKYKIQTISSFKITCHPNNQIFPITINSQNLFRPYCVVSYRDVSLKLPIKYIYISTLSDDIIPKLFINTSIEFFVDVNYNDNVNDIIEVITLSVSINKTDIKKLKSKERKIDIDDLPMKHNNNMEMILDLYFGELYATIKDKIKFGMRTWNHDGYNRYTNIIYTYPSLESHNHIGTFQRFNSGIEFFEDIDLTFVTTIINENQLKILKELENDSEYSDLINKKVLLELEKQKHQEIINFANNTDFVQLLGEL
jgi:hypothetical protein